MVSGAESGPWAAVERVLMGGAPFPFPFPTTLWALWQGRWLTVHLPGSLLGGCKHPLKALEALPSSWSVVLSPRGLGSLTWRSQRLRPSLWRQDRDPLGGRRPWSPLVPEPCSVLSTDDKTSPLTP